MAQMALPPETQSRTAAPPTNRFATPTDEKPDISLVVEDEEARRCEAQFSRLQAALGLKKKITEDEVKRYKYGDSLTALGAYTPVGSVPNMVLVSMDIEIRRNADGAITSIALDIARFSTSRLANKPPKEFTAVIQNESYIKHYRKSSKSNNAAMSEEDLGYVRYHIQSMIHPCTTSDGDIAWGVHDHTGHKKCFRRNHYMFIFPNKQTTVRDLQSLGYDPTRDICTREICDLRELDKVYLARGDAKRRGPYTGNKPTVISKGDDFSTPDEILKTRECFSPSGKPGARALDMLRAAVKVVTDDATTAGWARTREQIYGGLSGPPPILRTVEDVDMFLLELDLARAKPSSKRLLDITLKHERDRFRELPARMKVAFSVNRAQCHRYVIPLAAFSRFASVRHQTTQTLRLMQIASQEARVRKLILPATDYIYQAPVVVSLDAPSKSTTAQSGRDTLRNGQSLPPNLVKLGLAYQKASRDISTRLVNFLESQFDSKPECIRVQTRALYTIEAHTENGVSAKYPRMRSGGAFKSIASRARQSGWAMDDEVAGWFITAIQNRRELRNWYDRLPSSDPRLKENEENEAWLQTMIEVVVALAGHQA